MDYILRSQRLQEKICQKLELSFTLSFPRKGLLLKSRLLRHYIPPKKINGFGIARFEIATVACGSFAMTLLVHFLMHTS